MLTPAYIGGVRGLNTEQDPNDVVPNALTDCNNVVFSRPGYGQSRHGHPPVYFTSSSKNPFSLASGYNAKNVIKYTVNTTDYYSVLYTDSSSIARVGYYSGTSGELSEAGFTYTDEGVVTSSTSTSKLSSVNTYPRQFAHDDRVYYLTDYGLFWNSKDFSQSGNQVIRFPVISSATHTIAPSATASNNWFAAGYKVGVQYVFEQETKLANGERLIQSEPSQVYTLTHLQPSGTPTSNFSSISASVVVDVAGTSYTLKVYRTRQVRVSEALPTEYFLCLPDKKLTASTTITFDLTLNDDAIIIQEKVYTSPNEQGIVNANHVPVPASDVVEFKNYYVYSNFIRPAIAHCAMTTLPANNDTFVVTLKDNPSNTTITKTLTFKTSGAIADQANIDANATSETPYVATESNLSFDGNSGSTGRAIRIVPGTAVGEVEPYAQTTSAISYSQGGTTPTSGKDIQTIKITPVAGNFDIARFESPGHAAIVNSSGEIVLLFSYENVLQVPTTGLVEFEYCQSAGQAFQALSAATYYVYYIPGSNVANLPIYIGNNSSYYSLLPAKYRLDVEIGYPYKTTTDNGWTNDGGTPRKLQVKMQYAGTTKKPQSLLIDNTVNNLVAALQTSFNTSNLGKVKVTKLPDPAEFQIELVDHALEKIDLSKTGTVTFEPSITTSPVTIAQSEAIKNGFLVSKQNNPESIPVKDILTPTFVGKGTSAIIRTAKNEDNIYFFKEDGIYRGSIADAGILPDIQSVIVFDTTFQLVARESVQEMDEAIYFLSQKGFARIVGSNIDTSFAKNIETEIKTLISKVTLANVRSYANEFKRQYVVAFPAVNADGSGVSYIYDANTGEWSKSDIAFDCAHVDSVGRVTSFVTDYLVSDTVGTQAVLDAAAITSTKRWQYIRQDKYTGNDPYAAADQYDEKEPLTGASASTSTNQMTIVRTGTNYPTQNLNRFAERCRGRKLYYYNGTTLYPCTVVSGTDATGTLVISFDNQTTVPVTFTTSHFLVVGVNASYSFARFTGGNPSTLKRFSGFHVHTDGTPNRIGRAFRVDTESAFSTTTFWTTSPANSTEWVTWLPLNQSRGRWLERKITHTYPFEHFKLTGQTVVFDDSRSTKSKKQ